MARIGETPTNQTEDTKVVNSVVVDEQPVPDNVVTLSSGVRVQFLGTLPAHLAQQVVVSTFQNANLDANGNVRNNMSSIEQLKLAKRIFEYNQAILSFAIAEDLIRLYDGLPTDMGWLKPLTINPLIRTENPHIDFNDPTHQTFLYLMYRAFANEKDLEYISEKLLAK